MSVKPPQSPSEPQSEAQSRSAVVLGSLWAGVGSAVICYVEYVGLGAVLGPALLGYGAQSKSVGALLVVASAALACLILAWRRTPMLAGPRGAGMAVLVLSLLWLQQQFPSSAATQVILLAALMCGSALMQLATATAPGQAVFDRLPPWLVPSFIYASAISIAAGAINKYVYHCLQRNEVQTWGIFLSGTLLAVGWPHACRWLGKRLGQGRLLGRWIGKATGLAFMLGAALAWWMFEHSALAAPDGPFCARLGRVNLDVQTLTTRWQTLLHWPTGDSLLLPVLAAMACGLMVGAVNATETRTALDVLSPDAKRAPVLIRWMALSTALLGGVTSVAPSISTSRSLILGNFFKPTALAVFFHSVALIILALLAGHWLAELPQLALAVLMTAVATQMVTKEAVQIWRSAYDPQTPVTTGLRAGVGFWLVILLSVATAQPLVGLVLPALLHYAIRFLRGRRSQQLRNG